MNHASRVQRTVLGAFLLLVALFAGLAIFAILSGTRSRLSEELLFSIVLTGAAGVLGLISAIVWSRRLWHPIGPIGLVLTVLALGWTLFLFWAWRAWRNIPLAPGIVPWWMTEAAWSTAGILWLLASAISHIALFSFARLKSRYRWVLRGTILMVLCVAGMILLMIFDEWFRWGSNDTLFRVLAALVILDIAGSLAVPILHRFSALDKRDAIQTVPLELSVTCPRCAMAQTLAVGRSSCARCGLRFVIEIEENVCEKCGYPLYKLESAACPECGTAVYSSAQPVATG